jgi:hypothetical protein
MVTDGEEDNEEDQVNKVSPNQATNSVNDSTDVPKDPEPEEDRDTPLNVNFFDKESPAE